MWKKEVESWRRREMAWQEVIVEFERKVLKKDGQEVVVKLLERFVSKGLGRVKVEMSSLAVATEERGRSEAESEAMLVSVWMCPGSHWMCSSGKDWVPSMIPRWVRSLRSDCGDPPMECWGSGG